MDLNFSLKNIDGSKVSLDDFPDADGFIVVFSCNHCPHVIAYEQRMIELSNKYSPLGWPLISINSNDEVKYPQDNFENMVVRARQKGFPFPYLRDESQEVARAYGAERTPHVFIVQRFNDGSMGIAYSGAIDDNERDPLMVVHKYVEAAIDALRNDEEVPDAETLPVGCSIKWK